MPHLNRLRAEAPAGVLESTAPPLTPVAWTSMVTGMSPGHHGVYEFFHRTEAGWLPVSRRDSRRPALDEILEGAGRRSILINLPLSTPARSGAILLADFLARGDEPVQPPELRAESAALRAYRAFWDPVPFAARSVEEIAREVRETEAARFRAARHLLETKDWDFAFYGITGTDHLQHRALDLLLEQPEAPAAVLDVYRDVDAIIAWAVDLLRPEDLLLVTSDHGSAVTHRQFFLNQWLVNEGYATWRLGESATGDRRGMRAALRALAFRLGLDVRTAALRRRLGQRRRLGGGPVATVDDERSRAFMPSAYAWPAVHAPATDAAALAKRLGSLVDPATGRALFDHVALAPEVYPADRLPGGPDIVLTPAAGISVHPGRSAVLVRDHLRNHHKSAGILIAQSDADDLHLPRALGTHRVEDIAPTVLTALGLAHLADGMDGQSLVADPARAARLRVRAATAAALRRA